MGRASERQSRRACSIHAETVPGGEKRHWSSAPVLVELRAKVFVKNTRLTCGLQGREI